MELSHSKLNCILNCPMTYYLRYVQGIKLKQTKSALAIGSAVHWGIEHNTDNLEEYFAENGGFKYRDSYTREQLLAESMTFGYLKHKDEIFEQILKNPEDGSRLELLEETHELYIKGKLSGKHEHDFVGIIDLLLLTNKGFIIIDYKTSSYAPNWEDYKDQLYRYIFEVRSNFPDIPILKIGIINLRKTNIRQKKNENSEQFFNRLKLEYKINDEDYINYHEYLSSEIDDSLVDYYIKNLTKMADFAQNVVDNKQFFINFSNATNNYGKSDYWDIFYHTENAEIFYDIKDYVYDEITETFLTKRDCVPLDMQCIDNNVLNHYEVFKEELLKTETQNKYDFFKELSNKFVVDFDLLEKYWLTFIKEKKEENGNACE